MRTANLKKKLILKVLLPMIIGMCAMILTAYLPFYLSYPTWINTITSDMINDRKTSLSTIAGFLSLAAGSAMACPIHYLQLASQLYQAFYNGAINIKPGFSFYNNSVNAYEFQMNMTGIPYGYDPALNKSFETSMWYLGNTYNISQISPASSTWTELFDSSVFDFFLRPIVRIGNPANSTLFFQRAYIGFQSDGLFYVNPTEYQSYYVNFSDGSNCTYEIGRNSTVYDPRCRPWYQQAESDGNKNEITITEPYLFADNINIGSTFCTTNYFINGSIRFASCIDFGIGQLSDYINVTDQGNTTYAFAVSPGDETFVHPHFQGKCSSSASGKPTCLSNITSVEMEGGSSSEISYFTKEILPLFNSTSKTQGNYELNGQSIMVVIAPIVSNLKINRDAKKVASLGLRLEESTVTDPFNELKEELNQTLYIEGLVLFLLFCAVFTFCWFLTGYMTQQIINPIDNLINILDRMKDGDVDINIEEHYQLCSEELTKLYKVFTKLKIVLKFGKSCYFQEDSEAVMNYSQALSQFLEFKNLEGAGVCYNNLGIIHFKNLRFHEAVECFAKALEAAESLNNSPELVIKRKHMLATALLAWEQKIKRIPGLLHELIGIYKQKADPTQAIECLLLASEHCIKCSKDTHGYLEEAEELLSRGNMLKAPKEVLESKILYCKGLLLCKTGMIRQGCQKFIDCLTLCTVYDPETRKKSLIELKKIYKKYSISVDFLQTSLQHCEEQLKDVVFLLDYSMSMNGSRIKKAHFNICKVIEAYLKPSDRLACITFNKTCSIVFNLTPRSPDSEFLQDKVSKCDSPKGGTAFYDAVMLALQEFSAYKLPEINSVPFDAVETKKELRTRWILGLIDGEDNSSNTTFRQVKKKLAKRDVSLAVIGLAPPADYALKMQELCESTRKGLFINSPLLSDLDSSFRTMSVLISSKVEHIESLD